MEVTQGHEQKLLDNLANMQHRSFEELTDYEDNSQPFLDKILQQAKQWSEADNEQWKMHYDAIDHLRTLNKFHNQFLLSNVSQFNTFVSEQIVNLRSNNSKNALELCKEIFTTGESTKQQSLAPFVDACLPNLLTKTIYDKKFIAELAKKAVIGCATTCPFDQTLMNLVKQNQAKNLNLAEFSGQQLLTIATNADIKFFIDNYHLSNSAQVDFWIHSVKQSEEPRQSRLNKHIKPMFKIFVKKAGEDELNKIITDVLMKQLMPKQESQQPNEDVEMKDEESKQDQNDQQIDNEQLQKINSRVQKILSSLKEPEKKGPAAKAGGFRSFMKKNAAKKEGQPIIIQSTKAPPKQEETVVMVNSYPEGTHDAMSNDKPKTDQ